MTLREKGDIELAETRGERQEEATASRSTTASAPAAATASSTARMHVLEKDTKLNKRGIYAPVAADPDKCTGCNLCEMYCGNFAIGVGEVPSGGGD